MSAERPDTPSSEQRPRRRRVMRRGARIAERVARVSITLGGVGTILAVCLIFVFLFSVAVPLFRPADTVRAAEIGREADEANRTIVASGIDEYGELGWTLDDAGRVVLRVLNDGRRVGAQDIGGEAGAPISHAIEPGTDRVVFGFADGTARFGTLGVSSELVGEASVEAALRKEEGFAVADNAVFEWLRDKGLVRISRLAVELGDPIEIQAGVPLRLVDRSQTGGEERLIAYSEDGTLGLYSVRSRRNMLTREVTYSVTRSTVPNAVKQGGVQPSRVLLSGNGTAAYLAWDDGTLHHYDFRDLQDPQRLETIDVTPDGTRLTAMGFLLGSTTILVGDEHGVLSAWFPVRTDDGLQLADAHDIDCLEGPITTIASSGRTRVAAVGGPDGELAVVQVTTNSVLARVSADQPAQSVALSPKEDRLASFGADGGVVWDLDVGFPEATFASLFGRVWYEGYPEPDFTWQSTGGTDAFEPKLSLMPLVYGTLKATFYSMLFGAPLAILAAIYSSEFLASRTRASLKSLIEIMAGLPSVVLGFLAALVFAPFVQGRLIGVLLCFFTVPICLLFGAQLFRFVPRRIELRLEGVPRLLLSTLALPIGILAANGMAGPLEAAMFGGDLQAWLDGRVGGAAPAWAILFLPLVGAACVLAHRSWIDPRLREVGVGWSRPKGALVELGLFVGLFVVTIVGAWLLGSVTAATGFDLREEGAFSPLGTYVQRNSLVVGFVMGFAIIPVIYTLSEDALSSVPNHLRLASLATGATRWQTAARVIVPTAASGIFSALMVGLGRAVGETMIVLMATGNTPVMELNLFNGLRTLSANLAVELPEAVKDSTHYRTLFLAALTLFAMTFVVNTLAESVRQHFRKRAHQL